VLVRITGRATRRSGHGDDSRGARSSLRWALPTRRCSWHR